MLQKSFFDSNLKLRRERLTLRGFYYPNTEKNNAGKNDSGVGEDDSMARPMGLAMTRPLTCHPT
jgi:hypothetical protein